MGACILYEGCGRVGIYRRWSMEFNQLEGIDHHCIVLLRIFVCKFKYINIVKLVLGLHAREV